MVEFLTDTGTDRAEAITALVTDVFTASEGAQEGALIGGLAQSLIETTPSDDIYVCRAEDETGLMGCILFTRLTFDDPRAVFILGPVAVATQAQGRGIGQRLISYGLDQLRAAGVDIALTYGDPAFYSQVGFRPLSEDAVPAPYRLQLPEGWQGQSLTAAPVDRLNGPSVCVPGFADPHMW